MNHSSICFQKVMNKWSCRWSSLILNFVSQLTMNQFPTERNLLWTPVWIPHAEVLSVPLREETVLKTVILWIECGRSTVSVFLYWTYNVWMIKKPDILVIAYPSPITFLFSTSPTNPSTDHLISNEHPKAKFIDSKQTLDMI